MGYSFPWNNAVPAGSDPANQLDTFITDLKSALSERMEDKFINSMTADPWVVQPEILGNVIGKVLPFHWIDALVSPEASSLTLTNKSIRNDGLSTRTIRIPVGLPNGITITEFHGFAAKGAANVVMALTYGTYDASFTETIISTLTRSSGTFGQESATGLTHVVDLTLYTYFIEITLGISGGEFGYGHIIYDTPDCRNTR